jgi:hypothetical protein
MSGDRTFEEVTVDLRISKRTLDGLLSADLLRPVESRRFQFHTFRGRKRIWSVLAFEMLKSAIERESAPGGVLAGSRSSNEITTGTLPVAYGSAAVRSAYDAVLTWPSRPSPKAKPKPR